MGNGDGLSRNGKWTLANVIISVFTAFFMALTYWMLQSIINLREFQAAGERFTVTDSHRLKAEIVAEIKTALPPKWLVDDVDRMNKMLEVHEERIDKVERGCP